jgi:hypothetical protein
MEGLQIDELFADCAANVWELALCSKDAKRKILNWEIRTLRDMHPRAQGWVVCFYFNHYTFICDKLTAKAFNGKQRELSWWSKMKKTLLAAFIGGIVLTIHFTLCALSALSTEYADIGNRYTQPLFQQPWSNLGSELPTNKIELEFRVRQKSTGWSEWTDATSAHSYEPSSQAERVEQSIVDELRWQLTHNLYSDKGRVELQAIMESSSYSKAIYYVMRMEKIDEGIYPDSVQLRAAIEFIPEMNAAPTRQLSYFNFPPYGAP